ncbi:MAG: thioredoxin family protein [Clostridia bacterium]
MASDKIIRFSDENFNRIVIKSKAPVLVDFWAPNCGPCRTLAPILEKLAEEYGDRLKIGTVNVEECPKTVKEFRISSVPTLALLIDGITEQRLIGLRPIEELRGVLSKYVRRNDIGESVSDQDA